MNIEDPSTFWMFLLIIFSVCLLIWGVFYVHELQSKIAVLGIVAIIITAFTSVIVVNVNNNKAKEREYQLHILKEKQMVFEHFYSFYFEILSSVKKPSNNNAVSKKAEQELILFKKGLMNWGSDRLIQKYIAFDDKIAKSYDDGNTLHMLNETNNFMKELRKELGFTDLEGLNLMSIILTSDARKEFAEKGVIK